MRSFFCATLLFFISISVLPAQILILDFGPTTTPNNSEKTLLPYNTGISSTSTFNTIATATNISSGLSFSDGTSATGLSLTFGAGLGTTATFPLSGSGLSISSSALGSALNTGIYAAGAASEDGIFANTGNGTIQTSLGLSIGGLAAGTYQIYLGGRNTNSSFSTGISETFFSTVSTGTPTSQNTSLLTGVLETNSTSASFIQGDNYVVLSETITAGQSLNIYASGFSSANEERAFLNYAEIVPTSVPEPQSFALMASGLGALVLMRRFCVSRNS